ncbi:hypothetical protein ACFFGV_17360 [Pontibacillus salicampi]|uniref:Transcriptional regulator n=1 Tax=Pontibacillus salicampi TaxID=1449801 RepID=A0ABV6LSG2_9BACI
MKDITIRIGVIGPVSIGKDIQAVMASFPNFHPVYRFSDDVMDAPLYTQEVISEGVEVLFYSGYLPYSLSQPYIPAHIPAHYIPLKGSGLFRALYKLHKHADKMDHISIDSIHPSHYKQAAAEIGETSTFYPYPQSISFEKTKDIVTHHVHHYQHQTTTGVLTGLKEVRDELEQHHVPVQWIVPTKEDITVALERALLSTESRKSRESQIVFGLLRIDDYDQMLSREHSETGIQRLNLQLHKLLLDYMDQLEGYVTELNREEYLFVTTRGVFERVTEGYKYIPLLKESKQRFNLSLSIGIGFGFSSREAGSHARIALQQAQDYGKGTCFIVRENKSVMGPVEMGPPLSYEVAVTDTKLLENAKKAGMTPAYVTKLLSMIQRKGLNQFTAQELGDLLAITTRSAHRILLQWQDADLIEVIGTEKISTRGRPRQIYRLKEVEAGA